MNAGGANDGPAPLIAALGIGVRRDGKTLLEHVNIEVAQDEIVTLIGPNGAGKTTLIRVLLGVMAPDTGTVQRRAGLRIGYVPQRFEADPVLPLTVTRFLTLGSKRPAADALDRILEETGIVALRGAPLHALSGGELQRALLARALLRAPELLILDEPVQGVDFSGQLDLYDLIGRLRREYHCGVLMVSHDLHVVMRSTNRVVCINRHLCCAGQPEAVSRHPEYVSLFGPRAGELAVYTHEHDHAHDLAGHVVPADDAGHAHTHPHPHAPAPGKNPADA
ncbi:MAG TPA: ATP-binding cassette domain-containing protein [Alphaproteobacteria bacterium]|nr:ATP-binding cassette domain-containing protein [Alphaproteobacteria bacterium]